MKPLIVLLGVFIISLIIIYFLSGEFEYSLAGRIALSVMLIFTASGHFIFTKGMTMMLPDFIPLKKIIIYLTGIFEVAAGICLLIPDLTVSAGWALIVFFLLVLPGNIYAAVRHLDYEKGNFEGKGLSYLWFRVPLQILFIVWTYFFAIRY